jgi:predicted transcriptional regulator of viral defense system
MTPQQESKLKKKKIFTLTEAESIGLSRQDVAKLVKEGKLLRMERGIFSHPKAKVDREIDFQIACTKLGSDVVVGGLSALFFYNLIEQVPQQVWVLVPQNKKTKSRFYRLIRTKTPLDKGIIEADGYKIVSLERAIIEGFKLATKIGERTAIKAARSAIQQNQTTLKKIGNTAREIGLNSYFTRNFETIIGSIT